MTTRPPALVQFLNDYCLLHRVRASALSASTGLQPQRLRLLLLQGIGWDRIEVWERTAAALGARVVMSTRAGASWGVEIRPPTREHVESVCERFLRRYAQSHIAAGNDTAPTLDAARVKLRNAMEGPTKMPSRVTKVHLLAGALAVLAKAYGLIPSQLALLAGIPDKAAVAFVQGLPWQGMEVVHRLATALGLEPMLVNPDGRLWRIMVLPHAGVRPIPLLGTVHPPRPQRSTAVEMPEKIREIIRALLADRSQTDIANEFQVTRQYVSAVAKRNAVGIRTAGIIPDPHGSLRQAAAIRLEEQQLNAEA